MTDMSPTTALDDIARLGWHGFKAEHGTASYQILEEIGRYFDDQVADELVGIDENASARDRLFETLMARFDQLQGHRPAIISIWKAGFTDPAMMMLLMRVLPKSMGRMLTCARLRSSSLEGFVKARVLSTLWLSTVRCWVKDDSEDMDATMAHLDKELARIEPLGRRLFAHDEVTAE